MNLSGRVFMNGAMDDPFELGLREVERLRQEAKVVLVDMHGEATSEKNAIGCYLDGLVSAVVGTHTHVPTCDHRVLPKGTAYCTDLGMTGPYESIIGVEKDAVIHRFVSGMPSRFETAKGDPRFAAVGRRCRRADGPRARDRQDAAARGRHPAAVTGYTHAVPRREAKPFADNDLGAILDALPIGLYLVDGDLRVVAWNRMREEGPFGRPRAQAVGRPLRQVLGAAGIARPSLCCVPCSRAAAPRRIRWRRPLAASST